MDKQIEEMKKHIKNSLSGVLEIEIDKLAEELMKYYQPKIPDGAVVLTKEEHKRLQSEIERLTEELAKYIQKAWFFYKRCKSYGIENFYDEDLEGQFKPATEGNTIAFGKFKWVEKQDGVEE